jgi:hypothetical protein
MDVDSRFITLRREQIDISACMVHVLSTARRVIRRNGQTFPAPRQTTHPGRDEVLGKSTSRDGDAFWRQSGAGIKSTSAMHALGDRVRNNRRGIQLKIEKWKIDRP